VIDVNKIFLDVSQDNMVVYITILDEELKTEEDILNTLKDRRIKYGINHDKIKELLRHGNNIIKEEIARGVSSINGKDAKINLKFPIDKKVKPKMNEDGTVDFKELNLIAMVQKDELLAKKELATNGSNGIDVFGRDVRARKGKDILLRAGKNTTLSEDGLSVYSNIAGQVLYDNGKISVSNVYEIQGDVHNNTGNIHFDGNIHINGHVRSGFEVEATGDVEVSGVVEGAKIKAGGHIIIHKGIQGQNNGYIVCEGNLNCKYIQNSNVDVKGDLFVDIIMHSHVKVQGSIYVKGRKGLVVGGETTAGKEIEAMIIGSSMATITKIETGINPKNKEIYIRTQEELKVVTKNRENVLKAIKLLRKIIDTPLFTKDKQAVYEKSIKTESFLKIKEMELNEKLDSIEEEIVKSREIGSVRIDKEVYPGVKICVNNAIYHVRDELSKVKFIKNEDGIKIIHL
jgi:uncharacterized protein (DUF342 family)